MFWHGPGSDYSWCLSGKGHACRQVTLGSEGLMAPKESALPHIPTERQGRRGICCFYLDKAKSALIFMDPESRKRSRGSIFLHAVDVGFLALSAPPLARPSSSSCSFFNIWNNEDSSSNLVHSSSGKQRGKIPKRHS